jgi:hypothetical protein
MLTRPFQYITLNGKLTLYATRDATDQLRKLNRVSITIANRERLEDVYIVTARAITADGRSDESTGVVSIGTLKGDVLANALMKAETKAKRRVTLSIVGLGWLDESELETTPAMPVAVADTGEIVSHGVQADTGDLQARVKALRDAERQFCTPPPPFSWKAKSGPAPLEAEITAARKRIAAHTKIELKPDFTDDDLITFARQLSEAELDELFEEQAVVATAEEQPL